MFYAEFELYNNNSKYVVLLGDFNARTFDLQDVTYTDEHIFASISVDSNTV